MGQITRRTFGFGMAAGAGALLAPRLHAGAALPTLRAMEGKVQLAPEGYPETAIWGYDGGVPGPALRVKQGERLQRRFVNDLDQPGTIHWHGIRIANGMDGVPGLTQEAVAPGESFDYDFVLPDAGTYWYHAHARSFEQVARGLYGALIVEEAGGGPDVDADETLLIDDWRLVEDAALAEGFGNLHDAAHGGRIGNWITVNGAAEWSRDVRRHDRLRLRLVNVANARLLQLSLAGMEGWIVALDGMPLETPELVAEALTLAPAQRADLIVDVTAEAGEEAFIVSMERDGGFAIANFAVGEDTRERRDPPRALPANPVAALGPLTDSKRLTVRMEGGAMGALREAQVDGKVTPIREMAASGYAWALNGVADMPDAPLVEAARGETLRIAFVNETQWPHGMHLHGHHFRELAEDGTAGPLRDAILLGPQETREIAFVADNPGDWLIHCHMLEHAEAGMRTWLRAL